MSEDQTPENNDEPSNVEPLVPRSDGPSRADGSDAEVIALPVPNADDQPLKPPPKTLFGALLQGVANDLARRASDPAGPGDPGVFELLDDAQPADEEDGPVNLTAERLRRKGSPDHTNIDLGSTLRETLARFVDQHAEQDSEPLTDPESNEATVRIDGEFVRKHGASLLPALLGGIAESITASMVGLAAPPSVLAKQSDAPTEPQRAGDSPEDPLAEPPVSAGKPAAEPPTLRAVDPDELGEEPPSTKVEFDVFSVLAALIKPPPAAAVDPEEES